MKKRLPRNLVCLFLAFVVLLGVAVQSNQASALSKRGSRGEEVRQIQTGNAPVDILSVGIAVHKVSHGVGGSLRLQEEHDPALRYSAIAALA